jgi:hypothetical protein
MSQPVGRECARTLGKGTPPWEQGGGPGPPGGGEEQQLVPDSGGGET